MGWLRRADRAGGGAWVDLGLYAATALFAWWTALASNLQPHRAWGFLAAPAYLVAAVITAAALLSRVALARAGSDGTTLPWLRSPGTAAAWRGGLAVATWTAACLAPLLVESVQRAAGRVGRAQEEVLVIEDGGRRLLESGTPYLGRQAIALLPDQLLGYLPYQPGMAVFGIPRALDPSDRAWSDARVWFALATIAALWAALAVLRRAGAAPPALVRALQAATVLPVAALTLATGGDDLPVLALCLLAFALAATGRPGGAGLAVGAAAALKLFAWPVALVLGVCMFRTGRGPGLRYLAGAVGVPVVTAVPALLLDGAAMIENVVAFPFGRGLVASPAASPLPGHLIATSSAAGEVVVKALLVLAVVAVAVLLVRRPPRTAASAALFAGLALLVAMLLLPSTRFGYLLYPAALLLWVPALTPLRHGDAR